MAAAIVTGGSTGIGLEMARELARLGHDLTLVARRRERLEVAREALADEGVECQVVHGDVSEDGVVDEVVAAHLGAYGRLDVLVNNAGVAIGSNIDKMPLKHLDLQIGVNLRSVLLFYRACVPRLKEAAAETGRSWVINTSSIAAKRPERWVSVYSATKAALVAFTQSMNRELARDGVHSCAICPSATDTDMMPPGYDVGGADLMSPRDVASAVPFLLGLSPQCVVSELVMHTPKDRP
jgi:NAD(P)-dependent dehydrogenase (short-subunit alcohol dehydrogenase family)